MKQARFLLALLFALPLFADLRHDVVSADGWTGYTVPAIDGSHINDCGDWHSFDSDVVAMKFLVERGEIVKMRVMSGECPGAAPVRWIHNVDPKESIRFLQTLGTDFRKKAMDAIAMHEDDAATPVLERIARNDSDEEMRSHALFWLGSTRGRHGYEVVREIVRNTGEPRRVREKGVFAMMQSKEKEKIDDVIDLARHDPESRVRSQALFWLSQEAGKRAAAALRDAVDNDPDADVKAKAVFGISQLPDDESIPLLVDLMKNNRSREVRRKAAFWLGQKNDPRAAAAIAEYLTR